MESGHYDFLRFPSFNRNIISDHSIPRFQMFSMPFRGTGSAEDVFCYLCVLGIEFFLSHALVPSSSSIQYLGSWASFRIWFKTARNGSSAGGFGGISRRMRSNVSVILNHSKNCLWGGVPDGRSDTPKVGVTHLFPIDSDVPASRANSHREASLTYSPDPNFANPTTERVRP